MVPLHVDNPLHSTCACTSPYMQPTSALGCFADTVNLAKHYSCVVPLVTQSGVGMQSWLGVILQFHSCLGTQVGWKVDCARYMRQTNPQGHVWLPAGPLSPRELAMRCGLVFQFPERYFLGGTLQEVCTSKYTFFGGHDCTVRA